MSEPHQHMCSSEQIAEGVVQQVDEGCCVQVGVTHHLRGEQGLSGATAEKASHHAVAHVHVVCHFLKRQEGEDKTLGSLQNHAKNKYEPTSRRIYYHNPRQYSIFIH